jgi:hypothetical protein
MKISKKREKIGTLFILGAGSSRALTQYKLRQASTSHHVTPLDSDFLKLAKKFEHEIGRRNKSLGPGDGSRFHESVNGVWDDWVKLGDGTDFTSLEKKVKDRLSLFDFNISIDRRQARENHRSNIEYLKSVADMVSIYLSQCKCHNSDLVNRFAKHVFQDCLPGNTSNKVNRVITFNYDDILETFAVAQKLIAISDLRIFSAEGERPEESLSKSSNRAPIVLNLHGSIRWRVTPEDFQRLFENENGTDANEVTVRYKEVTSASSWGKGDHALIVPPMPNKPVLKIGFLRTLWTLAFEYLVEAEELVVVGYSFPNQDDQARQLFLALQNKKTNLKRIVVVDPDSSVVSKVQELFGLSKVEYKYFNSLDGYLENYNLRLSN